MELDQKVRYALFAIAAAAFVFAEFGLLSSLHFGALDVAGIVDGSS